MKCKEASGDNPYLWIAFQSNCLNDRFEPSDNFESEFEKMMKFLRNELKFYSPNLTLNMRNSSEVGKLAKTLKMDDRFGRKITNLIQSLPTPKSSITAPKPVLFPILSVDLRENYFKLFEKATERGKINVILIEDEKHFDVKKIEEALIKCDINEEDIFVHTFKLNNTKEEIKKFLENKNGFLICEAELFTGMEADSVVYCLTDYNKHKSIRVNVMRACTRLNIVYAYEKDGSSYIDFLGANLDDTFMNGCDEDMKYFALKCLNCEKKENKFGADKENEDDLVICKSCFIRCHSGHEVEVLEKFRVAEKIKKEFVKCECKAKCINCNFNKH